MEILGLSATTEKYTTSEKYRKGHKRLMRVGFEA